MVEFFLKLTRGGQLFGTPDSDSFPSKDVVTNPESKIQKNCVYNSDTLIQIKRTKHTRP